MDETEDIRTKIEAIYNAMPSDKPVELPLGILADALGYRAESYIEAATIVDREGPQHWLPVVQLTGQAVELSLKACLAAGEVSPPISHDLLDLYKKTESLGFQLPPREYAAIAHLNHTYFKDFSTGTKYKARYPTTTTEYLGGAVPTNATYVSIVKSLLGQARQRKQDP